MAVRFIFSIGPDRRRQGGRWIRACPASEWLAAEVSERALVPSGAVELEAGRARAEFIFCLVFAHSLTQTNIIMLSGGTAASGGEGFANPADPTS